MKKKSSRVSIIVFFAIFVVKKIIMDKRKSNGGKRAGSGRKLEKAPTTSFRLNETFREHLDAQKDKTSFINSSIRAVLTNSTSLQKFKENKIRIFGRKSNVPISFRPDFDILEGIKSFAIIHKKSDFINYCISIITKP